MTFAFILGIVLGFMLNEHHRTSDYILPPGDWLLISRDRMRRMTTEAKRWEMKARQAEKQDQELKRAA